MSLLVIKDLCPKCGETETTTVPCLDGSTTRTVKEHINMCIPCWDRATPAERQTETDAYLAKGSN